MADDSQKPKPRVAEPPRRQGVIRFEMPEDTLAATHPARVLWEVVGMLDLSAFLRWVKAVDGTVGRKTGGYRGAQEVVRPGERVSEQLRDLLRAERLASEHQASRMTEAPADCHVSPLGHGRARLLVERSQRLALRAPGGRGRARATRAAGRGSGASPRKMTTSRARPRWSELTGAGPPAGARRPGQGNSARSMKSVSALRARSVAIGGGPR